MMFQHRSTAELTAGITGGSFVTAHWFVVADSVAHFAANVVAIVTGVPVAIYYIKELCVWVRKKWSAR